MSKLTHLDEHGAARMVDVSEKVATDREARAEARIVMSPEAFAAVAGGNVPKGDVLSVARIAGIMAAKKTPELIPLCHPLALAKAKIEFELEENTIRIVASVKTHGPTGVEMEALTAASISALTIYDMIKAVDKGAVIEGVRLLEKSGGESGAYAAPAKASPAKKLPLEVRTVHAQSGRGHAKPATLMGEVVAPKPNTSPDATRESFRAFMTSHRLRASVWAKDAQIPVGEILSFLTGRSRGLSRETAERLARAAKVRVEEMFR